MSNSLLHTIISIFDLLIAHVCAKLQYFRKFSYLHVYYILEKFPTYTIIRNCTFINSGVIFLPARLFGHYDYSAQQSNHSNEPKFLDPLKPSNPTLRIFPFDPFNPSNPFLKCLIFNISHMMTIRLTPGWK